MRLQSGGEELLREAAALDPDFALAHAALAMLGHEAGAATDVAGVAAGGPPGRAQARATSASAASST